MTDLEARLAELLDPLRAQGVGALLQALAAALEAVADVETEPVRRDADGRVLREGPLALPERADLAVTQDGRRLLRRAESEPEPRFEPVTLVSEGGFTTVLSPFRWEAAELLVEARQSAPDWGPLRLWFLEWFQPSFADVAPDLDGCVHRLSGPWPRGDGWRMELDLGSAPVAAVPALLEAVRRSGALRLHIREAD